MQFHLLVCKVQLPALSIALFLFAITLSKEIGTAASLHAQAELFQTLFQARIIIVHGFRCQYAVACLGQQRRREKQRHLKHTDDRYALGCTIQTVGCETGHIISKLIKVYVNNRDEDDAMDTEGFEPTWTSEK